MTDIISYFLYCQVHNFTFGTTHNLQDNLELLRICYKVYTGKINIKK